MQSRRPGVPLFPSSSRTRPFVFQSLFVTVSEFTSERLSAAVLILRSSVLRAGCWGEETSKAVVLKISNKEDATGSVTFLIIGLNPRRRFDSTYKSALEDFRLLVLGSLKSITAVSRPFSFVVPSSLSHQPPVLLFPSVRCREEKERSDAVHRESEDLVFLICLSRT